MSFAHKGDPLFVRLDQPGIIPCVSRINVQPLFGFGRFKALGDFGDIGFGDLVFDGYGDSVAVIPDAESCRNLHDACGVERFPKRAFGQTGIARGDEGHFIALIGQLGERVQFRTVSEFFRSQGKAESSPHLAGNAADIRGDVVSLGKGQPIAIGIDKRGGEVIVKLTPSRKGIVLGITVEMSKEVLDIANAQGKHPCLVAVISGAEVALLEVACQDDLWHFLALAGDGKVCFAGQHLASGEYAAFP